MAGFDIKEKIEHNVKKAVADFQERDDITTKFGEPVLAYVYAKIRSSTCFGREAAASTRRRSSSPGIQ